MTKLKLKEAQKHPNFTIFSLLALFIPFVGLILGIVYVCKEKEIDRVLGRSTLIISTFVWILGFVLLSMV